MNPIYSWRESPHRWSLASGMAITVAAAGTIAMFALDWSHDLARVWMWVGIVISAACLIKAGTDWSRSALATADEAPELQQASAAKPLTQVAPDTAVALESEPEPGAPATARRRRQRRRQRAQGDHGL